MSYARYFRLFATLTLVAGLMLINPAGQLAALSSTHASKPGQAEMGVKNLHTALPTPTPSAQTTRETVSEAYGKLPLSFESNQGQTHKQVRFLARGGGYTLFLTPTEAVLSLSKSTGRGDRSAQLTGRAKDARTNKTRTVLRSRLLQSNSAPQIEGIEPLSSYSNYFIGNDPGKWRTKVPHYAKVRYRDVYPGINLIYYGNQRQIEYDFIVSPGADPRAIKLAFEGAQQLRLDQNGDLVIRVAGGEVRQHKPVIYQEIGGVKCAIRGRFVLKGKRMVGFEVGAYDAGQDLVIDPTLSYSSYLGGSSDDYANGVESNFVVGSTNSNNFPTRGGGIHDSTHNGGTDVFVAKFDPSVSGDSSLVWATYVGGSGTDEGQGIALQSTNIFVAGFTNSTNFPTSDAAVQESNGGGYDAFATKLDSSGGLSYSTYHGGGADDKAFGIAVDSFAKAFITGSTQSTDLPLVLSRQTSRSGTQDAFVAKFNTTASGKDYSIYLGGNGTETGFAIALNGSIALITGSTTSTDTAGSYTFPATSGAYDTSNGGSGDAFVTRIGLDDDNKYAPTHSTFLGGDGTERGAGIKATSTDVYVAGDTSTDIAPGSVTSSSWPANTGAYDTSYNGSIDAFATKLNSTLSTLSWSTYLGGDDEDRALALAENSGNVYLTGYTLSTDFPTASAFQGSHGGGTGETDAFVTKINSGGASLGFSSLPWR